MEDQWKGKNVDLSLLSERIVQFFVKKEFTTSTHKEADKHVIVAIPKPFHGIVEHIEVHILGRPDDFSVKFVAGSYSNAFVRYGTLLSLIGGGFFVLKGLKSLEEVEKLEKEFWVYVDETIWHLADST